MNTWHFFFLITTVVADKNTKKLWIVNIYRNYTAIEFSYSDNSISETQKINISENNRVMFIRTFEERKHLIVYVDILNSEKLYVGVSGATHPILSGKGSNAGYLNGQTTINQNGISYYSLNEAPEFEDPTKIFKEDGYFYTECQTKTKIVLGEGMKHCVDSCPGDRPFEEPLGQHTLCRKTEYVHDQNQVSTSSQYYTYDDCTHLGLLYLEAINSTPNLNRCNNECISGLQFKDGDICVANCTSFVNPTENMFTSSEKGVCSSSCDSDKYKLEDSSLEYSDGTTKEYCLDTCPSTHSFVYTDSTDTKHCKSTCPSTHSFVYTDSDGLEHCKSACLPNKDYIANILNINTVNESGTCESNCPTNTYLLHEQLSNDTSSKKRCISSCNIDSYTIIYDSSAAPPKRCVEACNSPRKYKSEDSTECLPNCSSFHNLTDESVIGTTNETGQCSSTCSAFQMNYPLGSSTKYCLSSCSDSQSFFYKDNSNQICSSACPTHTFKQVGEANVPITFEQVEAAEPQKECLSACLEYKLTGNSNSKYCLPHCPTGYYLQEESSTNKTCLRECDTTSAFKYSTSLLKCEQNCPPNTPFIHAETNKLSCLHSCLPSLSYFRTVLGLKHCVSHCNDGEYLKLDNWTPGLSDNGAECVSTCSSVTLETNTQFTSNSLLKQYCLDSCPSGFYTDTSNSPPKCVSTCSKLATPDFKCVDDCLDAGYPYQIGENACSTECSMFINIDIFCVEQCPSKKPFSLNRHCVSKCPVEAPFVFDLSTCTDKCPYKRDGEYCVDKCGDLNLLEFFSGNQIDRQYRPYTLSTGECASECSEADFPLSHHNTLECLSKCPSEGAKYKNNDNVCREDCLNPFYPLKDSVLGECVSKCSEHSSVITPSLECATNCPSTHPIVDYQTDCSSNRCESNCPNLMQYCSEECNSSKFKLEERGVTKCICSCPLGYSVGTGNICQLSCLSSEGYAKNSQGRCIHCSKEQNSLASGEYCVEECPRGTAPSLKGECVPCFQLGLWVNEQGTCLRLDQCHPFSQKDQRLKTCFNCLGDGLMLLVRENTQPVCIKTNCDEGRIQEENSIFYCYECSEGRFYFNGVCNDICPYQLDYEMVRRVCEHSCHGKCTDSCCKQGRCKDGRCDCYDQFTGSRCDIPVYLSETIVSRSIYFLKDRMSTRLLALNEVLVIEEITLSIGNAMQRNLNEVQHSSKFIENALSLVKKLFTPSSFQTPLFNILDRLLGLASKLDNILENNHLSLVKTLINQLTDQIFPESHSNEALNTVKFTGKYVKITASLRISFQNTVDLSECLSKLNLTNWQFPFKIIEFSSVLNISTQTPDSMLISRSPFSEIEVFSPSEKINLPQICSKKDVDTVFKVDLNQEQLSLMQKFSITPYNLFDKTDPFFVDRCVSFSEEGKDLTLSERKALFLDPAEVCNETSTQVCTVIQEGEDLNCKCEGIREARKSSLEKVFASYPETNFILFTCHKVFKQSNLAFNKGFYVVGLPFILSLVLALCCSWRINTDLENDSKFEYVRQDGTVFQQSSMSKDAYFNECLDLDTKLKQILLINNPNRTEIKPVLLPTIGDLRHLTAEELLIYDKRQVLEYALDAFKQLHPTIKTLFKKSFRTVPTFELVLLATETNLTTAMSAFFIKDSMVQRTNIEGEPSLLDSITKDLVQTAWTVCTSTLIMALIKGFLVVDNKRVSLLTKISLEDKQNPRRVYDKHITNRRTSMIIFLFLSVAVNLILIYFIVIYTEIYANSQLLWLNGIVVSLVIKHVIVRSLVPSFLVFSRGLVEVMPNSFTLFRFAVYLSHKATPTE